MQEKVFKGVPISEGIAIGIAFFLSPEERRIPAFSIALGEVDEEIARYREALLSSREDLKQIKSHLAEESSEEVATIIDSHLHMLDDPLITDQMEEQIRHSLQNPESVLQTVMSDYSSRLSKRANPLFQQRLTDVMDLAQRVLGHLCFAEGGSLSCIPLNSIVFAKELTPSQIASVDGRRVAAFVTESAGGHSHAALIARAKGIPYVGGVNLASVERGSVCSVIVDAQEGLLILNPTSQTLVEYQLRKVRLRASSHSLQKLSLCPAETIDGYPVKVLANLNHPDEWEAAKVHTQDGVGLFRSEYLLFESEDLFLSEEEQYRIYARLSRSVQGQPLVIRVFDIGGDKIPSWFPREQNPSDSSPRGIRFLLNHPDLFKIQLRALLRATLEGDVRLLLPLVSDCGELALVRKYKEEVEWTLTREGTPYKKKVPLGVMIELPSAALLCDRLAKYCDFFSIGTNDLAHYILGVDRAQFSMEGPHPSVIRMIKKILMWASGAEKEVTLCGEIASNSLFIPLLVGLGVSQFSCSPRFIPEVKQAIRSFTFLDAYELANQVLSLDTEEEVARALSEFERKLTIAG